MDRRTLLFIIASILVWVFYINFILPLFVKPQENKPVDQAQSTSSEQISEQTPVTKTEETVLTPTEISVVEPELRPDHEIKNSCFTAVFTNKGAALKSLTLNQYKSPDRKEALTLLDGFESGTYSLTFNVGDDKLNQSNWKIIEPTDDKTITFERSTASGLVVRKQFSVPKDKYVLNYNVSVRNAGESDFEGIFKFDGFSGISQEDKNRINIKGVRAYRKDTEKWKVIEEIDISKLSDLKSQQKDYLLQRGDDVQTKEKVVWTGLINKYFAAILIPEDSQTESNLVDYGFTAISDDHYKKLNPLSPDQTQQPWANNIRFYMHTKSTLIKAGDKVDYKFTSYVGPKSKKTVTQIQGKGVEELISYGWFGFISRLLIGILSAFFALCGNYGWAIILLTILIKIILFPITKKGQVSMYKMQQLQPKIKALQEKYKNDKQRLGVEQWKLWKEHGVNPLSGCLPLFLQLPVFIGLYQGLYWSIELRQSPFMFWINDLAQPDVLCSLPFTVPLVGWTELHLLPLLMTVSWLIQSMTQPRSPDPQARQQQKLFMFMPVIFLFFFYNVPSGLTLYWFVQTLLSIVEQQVVKKVYLKQ